MAGHAGLIRRRTDDHNYARQGDAVKCMECGRELVSITTTHLKVCCGLTVAEYRAKHSGAPTYDSEYIRKLSKEERRQRRAEYKLRWQQSHPKNYRQSMRKWELANPDKVNARAKKWYANNPDKAKQKAKRIHLRRFGITIEDYFKILEAQNGVCAICGGSQTRSNSQYFDVDHCHASGKIRGLLCNLCNVGLGAMRDNPDLLRKAALYLERAETIEVEAPETNVNQSE